LRNFIGSNSGEKPVFIPLQLIFQGMEWRLACHYLILFLSQPYAALGDAELPDNS
jgi:hypothetical protein